MGSAVWLYVPNLIGYARVALLLAFFCLAQTRWQAALACYLLSFAGDLFDGYFARLLNQASDFGAVLDMVTDRAASLGIVTVVAALNPALAPWCTLCQFLDISSHWFAMVAAATAGAHHKSKEANATRNALVRLYYGSYPFFAYLCVGQETAYIVAYVHSFKPSTALFYLGAAGCGPALVLKHLVNVAQLTSAAAAIVAREGQDRAKRAS